MHIFWAGAIVFMTSSSYCLDCGMTLSQGRNKTMPTHCCMKLMNLCIKSFLCDYLWEPQFTEISFKRTLAVEKRHLLDI